MIGNTQPPISPEQQWRKKYPSVFSGILSFLELVLTIIIIGCEVGSMLIDITTATIYVGLWAGLFFIVAWISQAASSCCCRSCGCATYTLVIQLISMFFAMCVIGFDTYYIINPTTCFFPSSTCDSSGSTRGIFYSDDNFNNIKIPLIKGQLAAGAVMFVLCMIYVIIYIVTSVRVYRAKRSPEVHPQAQKPYPALPTVSNNLTTAPPLNPSYPTNTDPNSDTRTTLLVCPTCNTTMSMTASKRPPV